MPSTSPARRTRMMEMRRCQERLRNAVISWDRRSHLGGFIVGCWLVFCLTACSGLSETFSEPSAFPTGASTALSSTRGTLLCSAGASALIAWGRIIGITSQTQRVEQVWCDHLMGQPTLQALVTVRTQSTSRVLDVWAYTNLTRASPTQIFRLQGLYDGDAKISGYKTILTAQADLHSSANRTSRMVNLTQDLFREFKWSEEKGTFVQVAFPGIYPDLTRFQAEADQERVNRGRDAWKRYAIEVARACVVAYLKWGPTTTAALLIGGNDYDLGALVQVTSQDAGTRPVKVTLRRLEGNAKNGVWIVQDLAADGLSITSPAPLASLASPMTIAGMGETVKGNVGTVSIMNHLVTLVGMAVVRSSQDLGPATFALAVPYTSSLQQGTEEGFVIFYAANASGSLPAAVVTVKVLLSA